MISNIVFVIWAWGASQGVEIAPTWQGRQWDWCDDQLTEWRVQGCPRPTRQQLVALQATADAKAAEVAAQPQDVTLGKAIVRTHPDGSIEIVRPIIMAASTNGSPAYGLIVTPEGDLATYLDHASPRPSPEETQRRIAEAVARKATAKAKALAEINGQLQQRIENLERLLGLRQ